MLTARYTNRWISYTVRTALYLRDGYTCVYCGADLLAAPGHRTLDHVTPRKAGGANDPANLITACRSCNCSKGARLLAQWRPAAVDAVLAQLAEPLDLAYTRAYLKARRTKNA